MWNLHANCKNSENSERVWKSFTDPSATALSRGYTMSFAAASDPKQLGVSPAEWSKCDAFLVILQTSEIPKPWFPLQKEMAEPRAANANVFGSGLFALSSAKASCWRQVPSFSTFLHGVFLSSGYLIAVFHSCHSNFCLYKHSVHLKGQSSKEDL